MKELTTLTTYANDNITFNVATGLYALIRNGKAKTIVPHTVFVGFMLADWNGKHPSMPVSHWKKTYMQRFAGSTKEDLDALVHLSNS
jgi:hypothetical protein